MLSMTEAQHDLLLALANSGWSVKTSESVGSFLPAPVAERYPTIPQEIVLFLGGLEECINSDRNAWFLCRQEFMRNDPDSFHWNEYELMSLEAAKDDPAWQKTIRDFWDNHFPFMMAVHSDYDFLAINLHPDDYGQVVHGFGPEFEQVSAIAPSFTEFVSYFTTVVRGDMKSEVLSFFA